MKGVQNERKEACCGCGACVAACPHGCLAMVRDEEGLDYPKVDPANCTRCGQCLAVCPVAHQPDSAAHRARPAAHICRHRDNALRGLSSSGGAFSALAAEALTGGAVVYGAAFESACTVVRHQPARNAAEIGALRGSKYVQSDTVPAFRAIVRDLKHGRRVFFTGTPCQVAGLRKLAGDEARGLVTCDLVCHGVPSPGVFANYMAEQDRRYGAATTQYAFRDKANGWNCPTVRQAFANGKVYSCWDWGDPFMHGFLRNAFLRPACHTCRFTGFPRLGDLTLGDYWGVGSRFPGHDDNRGTSLVLVNTTTGEGLFRASAAGLNCNQGDLSHAIAHNQALVRPTAMPPWRQDFFDAFRRTGSFAAASRTYIHRGFLWKRRFARLAKQAMWLMK